MRRWAAALFAAACLLLSACQMRVLGEGDSFVPSLGWMPADEARQIRLAAQAPDRTRWYPEHDGNSRRLGGP